jgi:hypothetical protein
MIFWKEITIRQKIHPDICDELNDWLQMTAPVPDTGTADVLHKTTVEFGGHYEADIKVVNSSCGPYIDAVLFHYDSEVMCLEPGLFDLINGEYIFETEGKKFTAILIRAV